MNYRRWLARLSFTFLILALVLGYDAYGSYRGFGRTMPIWRIYTEFAIALVCLILAFAGIKARHTPPEG